MMIDLFLNSQARVVSSKDDFGGLHFDVWFNGEKIFSSPFKHTAFDFAKDFNSLCQLPF